MVFRMYIDQPSVVITAIGSHISNDTVKKFSKNANVSIIKVSHVVIIFLNTFHELGSSSVASLVDPSNAVDSLTMMLEELRSSRDVSLLLLHSGEFSRTELFSNVFFSLISVEKPVSMVKKEFPVVRSDNSESLFVNEICGKK